MGGGFLLVPLQVMWSGASQRRSSGTSLAAILPIAMAGAVIYYAGKRTPEVDLAVALNLLPGSALGALIGAHASRKVPEAALKMVVAILLAVVGLKELHDVVFGSTSIAAEAATFGLPHYLLITAIGLVIGVLSGLTGVGGGIFMVPALVLALGLSQRVAQGTSLVAILPTAAIGAITYHRHGNVDTRAAGWIAVAGVPAAGLGAALALWLPVTVLAGLFGAFLLFASVRTWPQRERLSTVDKRPPSAAKER